MVRDLNELQRRYAQTPTQGGRRGFGPGPGRGPRGGIRGGGKPKNIGKTVKRLFSYVGRYRGRLVLVALCMLLTAVSSLFGSFLLAPIIDRLAMAVAPSRAEEILANMGAAERVANSVIERVMSLPLFSTMMGSRLGEISVYILTALCLLGTIYLVSITCSYLQSRLMLTVTQNSIEAIRNDLFERLQHLPVRYFDSHPTGELMSRFTNDIDNIDMMLNNSLTSIVSGVITLIGTFIFMVTTNLWLTLITVVFVPVFLRLGGMIAKRSSRFYTAQQSALGALNGYMEETVSGQKVVKVFNHEGACEEEFGLLNEDLRDKQFQAQFCGGVMGPIVGNTSQITYGITVGVGGVLMAVGSLNPGALSVFATYSRQFAMPINQISQQTSNIFAALAGAERVFAVMDSEPEAAVTGEALTVPIEGEVVLRDVCFGYEPGKPVLKHISLYAKPGQKIAFVGSTGAGKTTVTNLLNRFYDIDSGEITIDGHPLRAFDREHLRRNIAMVLQDTHLFTGTVRENIRYGRLDATDQEVIEAARTASAHSFIMRLEHGYDTVLEGDGANLSQGQRQLLNIARAALSRAPILVLDEATSSVDTRTERHIEHGMDRLMKNRTTFVIAHRLSTVRNANAIMVLEHGEIMERGSHEELLEQRGRYYELYTGVKELD